MFVPNFFNAIDDYHLDELRKQIISFFKNMEWKEIDRISKSKDSFNMSHAYKDGVWMFDLKQVRFSENIVIIENLGYAG